MYNIYRADDLVGTWTDLGLWMRHSVLREYIQLNNKDATLLAMGDFNGDNIDDVVGYWPDPGGLWVRYSGNDPKRWEEIEKFVLPYEDLISLCAGDMNGDGKDDIVGSWPTGVLYRPNPGTWVPLLEQRATQIATGDFNHDDRDDLVAEVYDVNFLVWDGKTAGIKTIKFPDDFPPVGIISIIALGTGDMNGDCFCDVLFSWVAPNPNGGVYYLDGSTIESQNYSFVSLYTTPIGNETAEQVTSGDIDGDGYDDLLGIWKNPAGVWVRYYKEEKWEKLHKDPALCITAGFFNEKTPASENFCKADFDEDGDVDGTDLAVFAVEFGRTDCLKPEVPVCESDFDKDGDSDGSDLAVFAADFGRTDCKISPLQSLSKENRMLKEEIERLKIENAVLKKAEKLAH